MRIQPAPVSLVSLLSLCGLLACAGESADPSNPLDPTGPPDAVESGPGNAAPVTATIQAALTPEPGLTLTWEGAIDVKSAFNDVATDAKGRVWAVGGMETPHPSRVGMKWSSMIARFDPAKLTAEARYVMPQSYANAEGVGVVVDDKHDAVFLVTNYLNMPVVTRFGRTNFVDTWTRQFVSENCPPAGSGPPNYEAVPASAVADSAGNLFVATSLGLVRFDVITQAMTVFERCTSVRDVAIDRTGNLVVTGWKTTAGAADRGHLFVSKYPAGLGSSGTASAPLWTQDWYPPRGVTPPGKDVMDGATGANVAVDGVGNVYVVGGTTDPVAYPPSNRILTLKYDPAGTLLWEQTFEAGDGGRSTGVGAQPFQKSLAVDAKTGRSYVSGNWRSPPSGPGANTLLIAYEADGTLLWETESPHPSDYWWGPGEILLSRGGLALYQTGPVGASTLSVYGKAGAELSTYSTDGSWVAGAVAADRRDNVYVAATVWPDLNGSTERRARAFGFKADQDGDGIPDLWEMQGVDVDGRNGSDMSISHADPLRKDIYVECAVMEGTYPDGLIDLAVADVRDAFGSAPVGGLNGKTGIVLHVSTKDTFPRSELIWDFNNPWGEHFAIRNAKFGEGDDTAELKSLRSEYTRFCTFAYGLTHGYSGITYGFGASDFIVAMGTPDFNARLRNHTVTPTFGEDSLAGTFMHELGHALGLRHGGQDDSNYKPNYRSIMNYSWQMPWLDTVADWRLGFSESQRPPIIESAFVEKTGFGGDPKVVVFAGPAPFITQPEGGEVDLDFDGLYSEVPKPYDVNFVDPNDPVSPGETLFSYLDWPFVDWRLSGMGPTRWARGVDVPEGPPPVSAHELDESTAEALDNATCAPGVTCPCAGPHCPCQPDETRPCGRHIGECRSGLEHCGDDLTWTGVCLGAVGPSPEVCNGLDDDCNGVEDDVPNDGEPCATGGQGACGAGNYSCVGDALVCVPVAAAELESCDGQDEDCDGVVDDVVGLGGACVTGQPGQCAVGRTTCVGGELGCDPALTPTAETCDGLDNDCNGVIDDFAGRGEACSAGLPGVCDHGMLECIDGQIGCQGWHPTEERCNGLDDDCDGQTDESDPDLNTPCSTGMDGRCGAGERRCIDGSMTCVSTAVLSPEICNGLDDDCWDGPDDLPGVGLDCRTGLPGICDFGTTACVGDHVACQGLAPRVEICNGGDDDCDGLIDEDLEGMGVECDTGRGGVCGPGTLQCTQGWQRCVPTGATPEICNGLDDDCDGWVDNNIPEVWEPCDTGGVGECSIGRTMCRETGLECVQWNTPWPETCNGLDDDCDGQIDNDIQDPGVPGDACDTGLEGVCGPGTWVCDQSGMRCAPTNAVPETCNGLDDDCDGSVDNVEGLWDACTTDGVGACGQGYLQCVGEVLTCVTSEPSPEFCNGVDDDCNGLVDDGVPDLGGTCRTWMGGMCDAGTWVCSGQWTSCEPIAAVNPELCNNRDDNCNGRIDEDFPLKGQPCANGAGMFVCRPDHSGLICNAAVVVGAPCDDGNTCTGDDGVAADGQCVGTPVSCGDGNACTVDTCDPAIGCAHAPLGCDDGDVCTRDDCDPELGCMHPAVSCDDTDACTADACTPGLGCEHAALSCDDANFCTADACDAATGCAHVALDLGTASCGVGECLRNTPICLDGQPQSCVPGNPTGEICDDKDNNCNGLVDERLPTTIYYRDQDGDGYGAGAAVRLCGPKAGYVTRAGDCADTDAARFPGNPEICDGKDNNCNGLVDDTVPTTPWYRDVDGDGFGGATTVARCARPAGYAAVGGDCADGDTSRFPGNPETCDGKDNNCDGQIDEGVKTTYYRDVDGDGFGSATSVLRCAQPAGYTTRTGDCADADATRFPGNPEVCDGKDNDCNGALDDGIPMTRYYRDADKDGYGGVAFVDRCAQPAGYVPVGGDCSDADVTRFPGNPELCDGKDNNCDAVVDEGVTTTFYRDADGDGFGSAVTVQRCARPAGYAAVGGDCSDADATRFPGNPEVCDLKDNNCDGPIDEGIPVTRFYRDVDKDGFGGATTLDRCMAPAGYVAVGGDCADADAARFPGNREICDGKDNDCNRLVDDGASATCGDGSPCTQDTCVAGACTHAPLTGPACDDGSLCTRQDACVAGVCVGADPVVCAALGTCEPATGSCPP